jgi:Mce-associated membrane protein
VASARTGLSVTDRPTLPRALLITATVLGLLLALVGFVAPRAFGDDGGSSQSEDRNQVAARANDFAVAYNTYDVADLAGYQKRVAGLLTPKYGAQFEQITDAVFKALKSKKQKSGDAKVLGVAVGSIDKDSAVAYVAVDASITNTTTKAAVLRHFRWKLAFVKTKGRWLVSNFESVAAVAAEAEDSTATPDPATTGAEQ